MQKNALKKVTLVRVEDGFLYEEGNGQKHLFYITYRVEDDPREMSFPVAAQDELGAMLKFRQIMTGWGVPLNDPT